MKSTMVLLMAYFLAHHTQKGSCPAPGLGLPNMLQSTRSTGGLKQDNSTTGEFLEAEDEILVTSSPQQ